MLDICQVVSYYNYVNRLADGLGVELEDFWTDEDLTLAREEYEAIGGYTQSVVKLEEAFQDRAVRSDVWRGNNPWPLDPSRNIEI